VSSVRGAIQGAERILIVDDEPAVCGLIQNYLGSRGYEVVSAATCEAALQVCRESPPDLAIVDHSMPDGTGIDLIPRVLAIDSELPIVILTGHATVDLAVRAMSSGAAHFLPKPVEMPALAVIVKRLLEGQRIRRRDLADHSREAREAIDPFAGESAAIRRLFEEAKRLTTATSPILILGETGVGKGVLARWLHQNGPSASGAFVDLNCAGLSRELLESELFGHERGAFTGAVNRKLGLLEVAHRGTLFLDEIGELDLTVQAKLLKVLEERRFRRVGDVRDRLVAVRFVAATHRDLREQVSEQRFRSDLYFRISAIPLEVPPLRERREDIGILAAALLRRSAFDLGRGEEMAFSPPALEALARYSWPGNIRELRNVVERAVLLSEGPVVDSSLLQFRGAPSEQESSGTHLTLVAMERLHIERVLTDCDGHVDEAAKILQIPRSSLYQKIKKLGIVFPKSRRVVS
jgi:DNA-binding NtrC family response regulator